MVAKEMTERQMEYLEKAREAAVAFAERLGHAPKSYVETFGCQMNARDSEKLRGILLSAGFTDTEEENEADLVLYNTCTVRDNADQHVYGRLGRLGGNRKNHPGRIVGLCGCLMQEPHAVEKIKKSYPFVNLVFGTHNLYAFPELLFRALTEPKRVFAIETKTTVLPESLPVARKHGFKSGVNIMYGCDNFCTYCIVPYVRGREVSREPEEILAEIEHLAADGVKEIMLLGQNVNSYGKGLALPATFAGLLRRVCRVEGIE
ncbi:MAG: radical SAM protein, partial [Lachnospiraceae bacterium]